MHSCFYTGRVIHSRHTPVEHRFANRLTMAYLDLEEVPHITSKSWLLSAARFAPASFREVDHCESIRAKARSLPSRPTLLSDLVKEYVCQATGVQPNGPVRLLTQLRQWGLYFSPLNLFFCYSGAGEQVQAIVAEVSNTPWDQRRLYILHKGNSTNVKSELSQATCLRYEHLKDFHVSPFRELGETYRWRLSPPSKRLHVGIQSVEAGVPTFAAAMTLRRQPWSEWQLAATLARRPVNTLNILAAIHWQALRLWLKRCPYFPHPQEQAAPAAPTVSPAVASSAAKSQ
ncbi:DUF1365 domain-containing protein [Adhaeretor mobilis]|uniref:DUF1365 domain-containing protein n=1 Tax=Adhaeretor mobilis TaxID=1930276 RepID=A0A517MSZ9_9BACT|nr:DUF1365 domain-containing protein [Adhaeretor mobilis]QDS98015.1 hypothetical protein HG15A2_12850 [Adhaeretor mobilis]